MYPGDLCRHTARMLMSLAVMAGVASAMALNYDVNYAATPPVIDGTVDAAWSSASAAATGFVDTTTAATPSTQQTHVRVLWDSNKLYLLYEADDAEVVAGATGNDTGFNFAGAYDVAELFLDPSWYQAATTAANDTIYHIAVDPSSNVYTYTEAGQGQAGWNLGAGTQIAFSSSGGNWKLELAIPWTELNSVLTSSPGPVVMAPGNGSIWGAQFGRVHAGATANNATTTKWHPTAGSFRARPFGTLTFLGGPAATGMDMSAFAPLYQTSFEAPTYTVDTTVSSTEVWGTGYPDVFVTTSTQANTGTQSVGIPAQASGRTLYTEPMTTASSRICYLQYAIRLPAEPAAGTTSKYRHVLYWSGSYNWGASAGTGGQVWFYAALGNPGSNIIRVVSYESADETAGTSYNFPGIQTFDDWSYVTLRVNEDEKTYEVWYNGVQLIKPGHSGKYSVRNRSTFYQMTNGTIYCKNFGTTPLYLDDYGHYVVPGTSAAGDWAMFE